MTEKIPGWFTRLAGVAFFGLVVWLGGVVWEDVRDAKKDLQEQSEQLARMETTIQAIREMQLRMWNLVERK